MTFNFIEDVTNYFKSIKEASLKRTALYNRYFFELTSRKYLLPLRRCSCRHRVTKGEKVTIDNPTLSLTYFIFRCQLHTKGHGFMINSLSVKKGLSLLQYNCCYTRTTELMKFDLSPSAVIAEGYLSNKAQTTGKSYKTTVYIITHKKSH